MMDLAAKAKRTTFNIVRITAIAILKFRETTPFNAQDTGVRTGIQK